MDFDNEALLTFMEYLWVQQEDDIVTIGITEEGLDGFDEVTNINMPSENTEVAEDEVCGELETDQGAFNLYSPIDGIVIEVNEAVKENAGLILEDPTGDGWLYKIEAESQTQLDNLRTKLTASEDDE